MPRGADILGLSLALLALLSVLLLVPGGLCLCDLDDQGCGAEPGGCLDGGCVRICCAQPVASPAAPLESLGAQSPMGPLPTAYAIDRGICAPTPLTPPPPRA